MTYTDVILEQISDSICGKKVSNFFIDCGQGDKFLIEGVTVREDNNDKNKNVINFHVSKSSMKWVEMDGKYPIQLTVCKG